MRRFFTLVFIAVLFCSLSAMLAPAQSAQYATIVGIVTDVNGAAVPGATVTATNVNTGIPRSARTTATGNYTLPNLPAGTYDVKVEAPRNARTLV